MAGHVVHMGEMRNEYKILVRKHVGRRPLGRPRYRWKDKRMDLKEIGGKVWNKFIWLRIGTSCGILQTW
jgi:hypothetical protein